MGQREGVEVVGHMLDLRSHDVSRERHCHSFKDGIKVKGWWGVGLSCSFMMSISLALARAGLKISSDSEHVESTHIAKGVNSELFWLSSFI